VDGLLSVVGSANFNHRSLLKDDEALAIVLDVRVAADLDRAFEDDISLSRRTSEEDLSDPGPIRRATEWLVRRVRREL
jgi:cardiolipin synthase